MDGWTDERAPPFTLSWLTDGKKAGFRMEAVRSNERATEGKEIGSHRSKARGCQDKFTISPQHVHEYIYLYILFLEKNIHHVKRPLKTWIIFNVIRKTLFMFEQTKIMIFLGGWLSSGMAQPTWESVSVPPLGDHPSS